MDKDKNIILKSTANHILVKGKAGSGKTTLLKQKVRHLLNEGVNPENILILSLTKKDAIKLSTDNVNNITTTEFLYKIYQYNYPNQKIINAPNETLGKLLWLYATKEEKSTKSTFYQMQITLLSKFTHLLVDDLNDIRKNNDKIYDFIKENIEFIKDEFNKTNIINLNIVSMICGIDLHHMNIPQELKAKYIFINHMENITPFEMEAIMKYMKHIHDYNDLMFATYEPTETLYEFGGSCTEKELHDGIFNEYRLDTHSLIYDLDSFENAYRAQPAIDYIKHTVKSNANNLKYHQFDNCRNISDKNVETVWNDIQEFVEKKHKAKEQICFMFDNAHNKMIDKIKEIIIDKYPDATRYQFRPNRDEIIIKTNRLINDFYAAWTHYEDVYRFNMCGKPSEDDNILACIKANMIFYEEARANNHPFRRKVVNDRINEMKQFISEWYDTFENRHKTSINEYQNSLSNGIISEDEFYDVIRDLFVSSMIENLSFKIDEDKIINNINSQKSADFVFTTIYGAMHDEFPNVIKITSEYDFNEPEIERRHNVSANQALNDVFIIHYNIFNHSPWNQTLKGNNLYKHI